MYRYAKSSNQTGYRADAPLSNDQIAQYAPSVLADSAHSSRGQRYAFIPTIAVLDQMRKNGFQPFEVRQTVVRDQSKRDHTKHMVRLRHPDAIASKNEVPEIILLNSHDGTSSYQVISGYFRFVCSNGLISGDVCNDIRVRHSGRVIDDVIEGSFRVIKDINETGAGINEMRSLTLNREEKQVFAEVAQSIRWEESAPISDATKLLMPRRYEDRKDDIWTTFNTVQENIIKGGLSGRTTTGKRTSTRAVTGVNENVRLNRAIWTLADRMAKLKQGFPIPELEQAMAA